MFLRIAVTFILAFIFGIERQKSHKPIGFGTFIFVSTGACALAITAINLSSDNPLGLLSAIVTGIGFLGAGALMKTTDRIFGFTSASTIWLFAIFGLVIGVGEYAIGMILYSLIWVVVLYDLNLEKKGRGSYQKRIMISTNKIISEKEIKDILLVSTKLFKLISLEVEKTKKRIIFIYQIEGNKDQINKIPNKLYEKDWFDSCRIE
ncbi:MAG: MgtC/SapB family protein [Nanoarchaeota archaeon]|nr:MgtC/SapB family protein [Nanoarchaeota archaeon]